MTASTGAEPDAPVAREQDDIEQLVELSRLLVTVACG